MLDPKPRSPLQGLWDGLLKGPQEPGTKFEKRYQRASVIGWLLRWVVGFLIAGWLVWRYNL